MGALHDVNASYYSTATAPVGNPAVLSGANPSDRLGWAAGAGLRLNFPMIGQGDYFQTQFNYSEGASRYVMFTPNYNWGMVNGSSEAFGVLSDCVYGGNSVGSVQNLTTGCNLTTAWGVNAAYEHHWSPGWQTSVYGGYDNISYNSQANAILCSAAGFGAGEGSAATAAAGCNNDWKTWFLGSRTQWNVSKTFYMGVDVMYSQLDSATTGAAGLGGYAVGSASTGESTASNWTVRFRAHKDFLP
jgi:hypothetical protein